MDSYELKAEITKAVDRYLEGAFTADESHMKIGSLLFEFEHESQAAWIEGGGSIGKNEDEEPKGYM